MNVDNISNRASTSKCQVTSKYFSKGTVLDESLTEFQEKKKNITGPKDLRKNVKKKRVKPIKGQKDIRNLINKKNDLVEYSKGFDHMCKQSGVDVDSEQLQLAIALSKSIQDTKQTPEDIVALKPLTSQERTNKIRTTLQEYGFKVPELKITGVKKKIKKRRNNYRLLLATDVEKQQIISDRYSQILFENVYDAYITNAKISNEFLYYKSTCIPFEDMKNDDVFYVNGLVERSFNTINRLRDYSKIPGRCVSPIFEGPYISFNDIQCSQDELDLVLSGSIAFSQDFLYNKVTNNAMEKKLICHDYSDSNIVKHVVESNQNAMASKILVDETLSLSVSENINHLDKFNTEVQTTAEITNANILVNETLSQPILPVSEHIRNLPYPKKDMQIIIPENSKSITSKENLVVNYSIFNSLSTSDQLRSQSPDLFDEELSCIMNVSNKSDSFKPVKHYDIIDLTQCVATKMISPVSNVTRKVSNDYMEITECIIVNDFKGDEEIDVTQNCKESYDGDSTIDYMHDEIDVDSEIKSDTNEVFEVNDIQEETNLSRKDAGQNSDSNSSKHISCQYNFKVEEAMDLTQSSDSFDELPDVIISGTSKNVSLDETVLINDDSYNISQHEISEREEINKTNFKSLIVNVENSFQTSEAGNNIDTNIIIDYNTNDNSANLTESDLNTDNTEINFDIKKALSSNEIDSLGKKDDISIDYDAMYDNIIENYSNVTNSTNKKSKDSNSSNNASTSNNLEPFELTDIQVKYAVNLGENSLIDKYSDEVLESNDTNNSCDELPSINMKNTCTKNDSEQTVTPIKGNKDYDVVKTPSNNEYIVKTAEVTPMQNFEAMSSPERNKELEKYGIKPFKRKRAIQLLTYIYNQTHPVVDTCIDEEMGSPSKRLKTSNISPKKRASSKSPRKSLNVSLGDKENIYLQTDDTPIIKDIACCPEDWVFQKREKAKVHSCRVPLHIAFHNYVSCRRLLRDAILCYEPINIDVVHKDLVAIGFRYNPKDLLKFMDKKCITVKTAESSRNRR